MSDGAVVVEDDDDDPEVVDVRGGVVSDLLEEGEDWE